MGLVLAPDSPAVTYVGYVLEAATLALYVTAAARRSPRGNRWPLPRTLCFGAGIVLFVLAVQTSPLADNDDIPWVHCVQHLVIMMVVPPLLVLGAPMTLLLRTVSPRARREIVAVLHDPAMKAVGGPVAGIGLTLEYYGTMFLVMLTPLYRLQLQHEGIHVAVHVYLTLCGLLFWMPLIGRDPTAWRPSRRVKLLVVALGVPAYAALWLLIGTRATPLGGYGTLPATHAAGLALGAGGVVLTVAGLALVAAQRTGARVDSRERWNARRMFATSRAMATQQATERER
jgi:cytochrome c oxidase assembly factor CtaG